MKNSHVGGNSRTCSVEKFFKTRFGEVLAMAMVTVAMVLPFILAHYTPQMQKSASTGQTRVVNHRGEVIKEPAIGPVDFVWVK